MAVLLQRDGVVSAASAGVAFCKAVCIACEANALLQKQCTSSRWQYQSICTDNAGGVHGVAS